MKKKAIRERKPINKKNNKELVAKFLSIITIIIAIAIYYIKKLECLQFIVLLMNLEGIVLLACSISFSIQPIGNGFIEKLKWIIFKFNKFGVPSSFDILRFYVGLAFIFLANVINYLLK